MNAVQRELESEKGLSYMLESMRKGIIKITHGTKNLKIGDKLGEGSTKTVYEVYMDGNIFAIALPNCVDSLSDMTKKWTTALQEEEKNKIILKLGLLTNPVFCNTDIILNDIPFTAIKMLRNQDLPYTVLDNESPRKFPRARINFSPKLNKEEFTHFFESTFQDLQLMIKSGVNVDRDSLNVAMVDGVVRVYLSDLWNATIKNSPTEDVPKASKFYIDVLLGSFLTNLPSDEYKKHRDFFMGHDFSINNPENVHNILANQLAASI